MCCAVNLLKFPDSPMSINNKESHAYIYVVLFLLRDSMASAFCLLRQCMRQKSPMLTRETAVSTSTSARGSPERSLSQSPSCGKTLVR